MSAVGKILVAVAAVAAIVALNYVAPGIGTYLSGQLGFTVSTFLVTTIGAVVIAAGFALLNSVLFRPQTPGVEASKVVVRLNEPNRWIAGGRALQGGGVVFGEFDAQGNFFYVQIHADSILTGAPIYYGDNALIEVDANGWIISNDYCLTPKGEAYNGTGTRVPYFRIWTTTYSETDPVPPGIAALAAALPQWTLAEHLLAGTTYSVVMCKSIKLENRYKVYKWRGPFGLGEPSISVLGDWDNMYDPRDPDQVLGDRTTYKPSRNASIVWAWFRTHPFGRKKPESEINWDRVAEQADICDQTVNGIEGSQPRYECGISIIDNKMRSDAERDIMLSCDGQLVFDDDGKTWLRVGYFYTPIVKLNRNRDIVAMESVEAQNGESETQGVIVKYLDPDNNYSAVQSAPWYNPLYYTPGLGASFLVVEIQSIQNHNQAMRIAKAIGMRSQPAHKLGPTTGLRGLRATQERIINLEYDNVFAGDYEVCTPIEIDASGVFCSLGIVPIDADRFTLLPGEEKPKPVADGVPSTVTLDNVTNVSIAYNNGRVEASFDQPNRDDVYAQFQYVASDQKDDDRWSDMITDMERLFAYSGAVDTSISQTIRWRTVSSGGKASAWSNNSDLGPVIGTVSSFIVTGGEGNNVLNWRNPTTSNFAYNDIFRADQFVNTSWSKNIIVVTVTAGQFFQTLTSQGGSYALVYRPKQTGDRFTVRARKGTAAFFLMYMDAPGFTACWFDLSNGTIAGDQFGSSTISPNDDGSYTCSIPYAGGSTGAMGIGVSDSAGQVNSTAGTTVFAYLPVESADTAYPDYQGEAGQVQSVTDTVSSGTYYYWIVSHATDGSKAPAVGPVAGTAT